MPLVQNKLDHVHYYQGGRPFIYYIVYHQNNNNDKDNKSSIVFEQHILGPDLVAGQKLQVSVPCKAWKCGRIVSNDTNKDNASNFDNNDQVQEAYNCCHTLLRGYKYTLIGEAVGAGFDMANFCIVTSAEFDNLSLPSNLQQILRPFLHHNVVELQTCNNNNNGNDNNNNNLDFDSHYKNDNKQLQQATKQNPGNVPYRLPLLLAGVRVDYK